MDGCFIAIIFALNLQSLKSDSLDASFDLMAIGIAALSRQFCLQVFDPILTRVSDGAKRGEQFLFSVEQIEYFRKPVVKQVFEIIAGDFDSSRFGWLN